VWARSAECRRSFRLDLSLPDVEESAVVFVVTLGLNLEALFVILGHFAPLTLNCLENFRLGQARLVSSDLSSADGAEVAKGSFREGRSLAFFDHFFVGLNEILGLGAFRGERMLILKYT